MRTNTKKILGALGVAGLVAATGSAFTDRNGAAASAVRSAADQQCVSHGAVLATVVYGYSGRTRPHWTP